VSAAGILLDRGWGKAPQTMDEQMTSGMTPDVCVAPPE
jgi:hypothetical protein